MDINVRSANVQDLLDMHQWLKLENSTWRERVLNGEDLGPFKGFINNFSKIETHFFEQTLISLVYKGQCLGFIAYSTDAINMMAIHPNYRRKGLGGFFLKQSEHLFFQKFTEIDVECMTKEAEDFWKKQGFQTYKKIGDIEILTCARKRLL